MLPHLEQRRVFDKLRRPQQWAVKKQSHVVRSEQRESHQIIKQPRHAAADCDGVTVGSKIRVKSKAHVESSPRQTSANLVLMGSAAR